MKLSLAFIANKLAFSYDIELLNEKPEQKYGTVRLYDSTLSTSTRFDPLVIIPAHCSSESISNEFKGIIWLSRLRPKSPLPTIWIKESVNQLVILDRVQNLFDTYSSWCDMVRERLLKQETFSDIVPLLSHVTVNPYYYADAGMRTLAIKDDDTLYASSSSWRMQLEIGRHPVEILSKFITSGELDTVNSRKDTWLFDSTTFHTPFISRTVFFQDSVFGHLFIIETYPDQEIFDTEILETFANLLEAHLNLSSLSYSSTGRPHESMLISQITGDVRNSAETDYLLRLLSWRPDDRYRVVVFCNADLTDMDLAGSAASAELQAIEDNLSSGKAFLFNGKIVCIINDNLPEAIDTGKQILYLCERFKWKAAISDPGSSFMTLRALYKRALATLESGIEGEPDAMVYHFEDYRLNIVFSTLLENADEDFLMHDDLRQLIAYDEENNSEFVETLKIYLDNERNSSKTADTMYLHRNSIAYRLDKMRSLMSSNLDDPQNRLFLMLSIYIWLHSQKQRGDDATSEPSGDE